jgi:hypothetical protein
MSLACESTLLRWIAVVHVTAPVMLLGKTIRLQPTPGGELRAADGDQPGHPAPVARYLENAFGNRQAEVRIAMEELADRYDPAALNPIGFRLYKKFRPEIPPGPRAGAQKRRWTSGRAWFRIGCFWVTQTRGSSQALWPGSW